MIYLITNQKSAFTPVGYSMSTVSESLEYLNQLQEIGVDTETRGFDPYTKELLSLQLGDDKKQYVIDASTVDIRLYKELLESKLLLLQNAKFDLGFLYHRRIMPKKVYDTFLAERILTAGIDTVRRSLDALVWGYCQQNLDKSIRGNIHREGLSTRVIKYAADDVKYLGEIKRKQQAKSEALGLGKSIALDNKYVLVLAYIEYCGVYLDPIKWEKKCQEDIINMEKAKEKLNNLLLNNPEKFAKYIDNQYDMFNKGFATKINWNSEKQVIPLMRDLGINTEVRDKKSGLTKNSIEKGVIKPQSNKHELVDLYLKYKEHQKEVSTYGENWFDYINPVTRRIHTNYTQIMNTGRLSSGQKGRPKKGIPQKPNMQNVPSEDRTRNCFVAEKGNKLIVADYSGQEQIVLANKSKDPDILKFYREGMGDMHSFVASKIYPELANLSLDEIKKNHSKKRQIAKAAGFAINYGGTGITIAQNLSMSIDKGEEVYKAYFKAFPGLDKYFKQQKKSAIKLGFIQFNEISFRKCFIPFFEEFQKLNEHINGHDSVFWDVYKAEKKKNSDVFNNDLKPKVREYFMKRGDIERNSLNYPIQGTSADITKLAGIYMFRYLRAENLLFKVLMPNVVHDEIHLECSEDIANKMAEILKKCMEKAGDVFCKTIKLKAEPCITDYWTH
jgi:DNA polymerase I-like protein with 3'-5' exonuclease and polymerase domains